jgi:hypothetical protein
MGRDSLPVLVAVPQQPVKLGRLLRDGFRHLVRVRHLPTHLWTTQERDLGTVTFLPYGDTTDQNQ